MELKTTFKVTARCKHLEPEMGDESYSDKNIDLYLNVKDAMMFLFKFTPSVFKLSNGMLVYLKFKNDPENKLIAMILTDLTDEKFIVLNPNQLWSEILEAYEEIRLLEKIQVLSSIAVPDIDVEETDEEE